MRLNLHRFYHALNEGFKSHHSEKAIKLSQPKLQLRLLHILQREGFIEAWWVKDTEKTKFKPFPSVTVRFKRLPGGRYFKVIRPKKTDLTLREIYGYDFRRGFNCLLLSTNKGILTHRESLRYGIGGKPVCELSVI